MELRRERVIDLLKAWTGRTATDEEQDELFRWIASQPDQTILQEHISQLVEDFDEKDTHIEIDWESLYQKVLQGRKAPARTVSLRRWMAAASVFLLLGLGAYIFFLADKGGTSEQVLPVAVTHDVKAPDKSKAAITLSDGSIILLDSLSAGNAVNQFGVKMTKTTDGQLVYDGSVSGTAEPIYNTLNNPKGSQVIDMMLADGSRVWLNAGSSVAYPVAFTGNERKVSINGEAYFEVAHDNAKPFFVHAGTMDVKVLGTHFNVNAYDDEDDIRTTLLEGSVSITAGKSGVLLRPGQQARLAASTLKLETKSNVDISQVMAWKNGKFIFGSKAGLQSIMRQIARWYDVQVVYNGIPDQQFGGEIPRGSNLSQVLEILKISGVRFTIEDRTVYINP